MSLSVGVFLSATFCQEFFLSPIVGASVSRWRQTRLPTWHSVLLQLFSDSFWHRKQWILLHWESIPHVVWCKHRFDWFIHFYLSCQCLTGKLTTWTLWAHFNHCHLFTSVLFLMSTKQQYSINPPQTCGLKWKLELLHHVTVLLCKNSLWVKTLLFSLGCLSVLRRSAVFFAKTSLSTHHYKSLTELDVKDLFNRLVKSFCVCPRCVCRQRRFSCSGMDSGVWGTTSETTTLNSTHWTRWSRASCRSSTDCRFCTCAG